MAVTTTTSIASTIGQRSSKRYTIKKGASAMAMKSRMSRGGKKKKPSRGGKKKR